MRIPATQANMVTLRLEAAANNDHQWMVFDENRISLKAKDMEFFKTRKEAANYCLEKERMTTDFQIVPVKRLLDILRTVLQLQRHDELQPFYIHINTQAVQDMHSKQLLTIKNNPMNEQNLEALKKNLKYLGFGESLNEQLEKNIQEQKPDFTLQHEATYNNQKMQAELSFKRGDQNEMYFFNKYTAKLNEPDDRQQTFYLDRGNGVTTKEAFNLLQGRAVNKDLVNKEGEKYNAWVQLDFSKKEESGNYKMDRYHENYKYNLEEAISKYPLKELEDSKWKEDLMKSLEKGNVQAVKMEQGNKDELMYIEANPKEKAINIYDKAMNPLNESARKELERKPSPNRSEQQEVASDTAQENKKGQKQKNDPGGDDDDGPELKKKRTRKKGLSV